MPDIFWKQCMDVCPICKESLMPNGKGLKTQKSNYKLPISECPKCGKWFVQYQGLELAKRVDGIKCRFLLVSDLELRKRRESEKKTPEALIDAEEIAKQERELQKAIEEENRKKIEEEQKEKEREFNEIISTYTTDELVVNDEKIYAEAKAILEQIYGEGAKFRPGQYEAIERTINEKRMLVVQRTGWGKSLVYFICTKILRNRGAGLTLVISPLLSLMGNQIEEAKK